MSDPQTGAKVAEAGVAILALASRLGLEKDEIMGALCMAFIQWGKHEGKKRGEMRKLFNLMAQQFSDDFGSVEWIQRARQKGEAVGRIPSNFQKKI